MLRCIWGHFLRVIQGTSPTLSHSSSLLHSLGSVTVRAAPREDPASAGGSPKRPGSLGNAASLPSRHLPLQVLCCVDKQGILSWPNPSPETVLFFSGKVEPPHSSHEDLTDDLSTRSFCHPEVEEEVRPGPGWRPLGGQGEAGGGGGLRHQELLSRRAPGGRNGPAS